MTFFSRNDPAQEVMPCAFTASLQHARAAQQLDRARQHMRSLLRSRLTRHARGVALSAQEAEVLIELLATPGEAGP